MHRLIVGWILVVSAGSLALHLSAYSFITLNIIFLKLPIYLSVFSWSLPSSLKTVKGDASVCPHFSASITENCLAGF